MDCTFIKDNIFPIVENQLPEAVMARARDHITGCNSCSGILTSFASLNEVIEKDKKMEINPFLTTRILQKLEAHNAIGDHRILFRMPRLLQPILAAALILLAVLTGFFAGKQGKSLSQNQAKRGLNIMKAELFISELNDEDKTLELYK
ncbi:MAG: hypothetical protein NTY96_04085 [Bacteroidetes bacterium]|nr:hypothetical protein [Bacteroidota bacterium]